MGCFKYLYLLFGLVKIFFKMTIWANLNFCWLKSPSKRLINRICGHRSWENYDQKNFTEVYSPPYFYFFVDSFLFDSLQRRDSYFKRWYGLPIGSWNIFKTAYVHLVQHLLDWPASWASLCLRVPSIVHNIFIKPSAWSQPKPNGSFNKFVLCERLFAIFIFLNDNPREQ